MKFTMYSNYGLAMDQTPRSHEKKTQLECHFYTRWYNAEKPYTNSYKTYLVKFDGFNEHKHKLIKDFFSASMEVKIFILPSRKKKPIARAYFFLQNHVKLLLCELMSEVNSLFDCWLAEHVTTSIDTMWMFIIDI